MSWIATPKMVYDLANRLSLLGSIPQAMNPAKINATMQNFAKENAKMGESSSDLSQTSPCEQTYSKSFRRPDYK
jgi:hypothetical protein